MPTAIMATTQLSLCIVLCKSKNLQLLRYDFNEPCCGKDRDREVASTKTIIRSYVDAGNNLVTTENVGKAVK